MLKDVKHLPNAISKAKTKLTNRAKKQGLSENFGRTMVHSLANNYINGGSYSEEMNHARDLIAEFNEWCMNYEG